MTDVGHMSIVHVYLWIEMLCARVDCRLVMFECGQAWELAAVLWVAAGARLSEWGRRCGASVGSAGGSAVRLYTFAFL